MGLDGEHGQLVRLLPARRLGRAVVWPVVVVQILAAQMLAETPASAQACRLALAFGLDVSASVDEAEYALQLQGLAKALGDPAVRAAMLDPGGAVALAAYEWSGARQQAPIAPWTGITSAAALEAFAARVASHARRYGEFPTAVGYALGYGAVLMREAPRCARKVIDLSGDGINNDGFGPAAAYREFDFADITVNGLVIGGGNLELISFYQSEVAHGPEAFVEVAADYADFARAMRRKLLRELGGDYVARRALPSLAKAPAWIPGPARHPQAETSDPTRRTATGWQPSCRRVR